MERTVRQQSDVFTLFMDPVTNNIAPNYSEVCLLNKSVVTLSVKQWEEMI